MAGYHGGNPVVRLWVAAGLNNPHAPGLTRGLAGWSATNWRGPGLRRGEGHRAAVSRERNHAT